MPYLILWLLGMPLSVVILLALVLLAPARPT